MEPQRDSLKASILQLQLERRKFTKEEIVEWISKYKYGNINDLDYRKEIIDTFVNSVFVYDDKLVLTYNYKDGTETLTLQEIESALSSNLTSMCPANNKSHPKGMAFVICVGVDSNLSECKCPVDTCCHQFKNWWLPLFSARRQKMQIESYIVHPNCFTIGSAFGFFVFWRSTVSEINISETKLELFGRGLPVE